MLDAESYAGQRFTARYQTNGYYDISATESGFQIEYKSFEAPVNKSFEDVFFGQWLDDPIAYGAFENGRLLGYVEGFLETWNNRYRISNICVFDNADRNRGIGSLLMDRRWLLEKQKAGYRGYYFHCHRGWISGV